MRTVLQRARILAVAVAIAACSPASPAPSTAPTGPRESLPASTPAVTPAATDAPSQAGLPVFDPAEPLLLVEKLTSEGGPDGIFVLKLDGTGLTQLGTDALPGVHKRPGWSPDGRHAVSIDQVSERMWIAHLDGSPSETVAACDRPGCDYPAWSPDGKLIAFSRYEIGSGEGPAALTILTVELATGVVTEVVRMERPLLADAPRWSPDGASIVFQVDRMDDEAFETGAAIAIAPATGGVPRYLTDFDAYASLPDWGWATNEIVFGEYVRKYKRSPDPGDETWDLFGIRPDGTGLRQITHMPDGQRLVGAGWTPDGQWLMSKQFDEVASGGRRVNPATGEVEPFVTDLFLSIPALRP